MKRILLAEDEPQLQKACQTMLKRNGFSVDVASDGNEALRLLGEGDYDLLITDIIMPDKEGIETIMEVRQAHPSLPIIAMSGGGRMNAVNYLELARRMGTQATLEKPFSARELVDAIRGVLPE